MKRKKIEITERMLLAGFAKEQVHILVQAVADLLPKSQKEYALEWIAFTGAHAILLAASTLLPKKKVAQALQRAKKSMAQSAPERQKARKVARRTASVHSRRKK